MLSGLPFPTDKRFEMTRIGAYQHGIYPRSEAVVAATRGLERKRTTPEEVRDRFREDEEDIIRVQKQAGLDFFSDGLLRWQDIFRPLVEASRGMEARTLVRWFDNNSFYRAPEISDSPALEGELPEAFQEAVGLPEPRVATLPSPYLFSRAAHTKGDRNELMLDLARNVLRPVVDALRGQGYRVIHLQEPWLGYFGLEPGADQALAEALQEIREGAGGAAEIVLHVYFGDAGPHAGFLRSLPVDAVGIDFVATDLDSLGTGWEVGILAGCLDGRSSLVESLEDTAAFARRVAEKLQPPALYLSSNCELEFLPRDVARQKVLRLGEAARSVKESLR
jgi:5-methyltetrahydropteroyltriglutamate--homocysteine methyltransferase